MNRTEMNKEEKSYILNTLSKVESTHTYVFAIRSKGHVYGAIVENAEDLLPLVTVCEARAKSKGCDLAVRMWNSSKAFKVIKEYARELIDLGTVESFETGFKAWQADGNRGNRGNYFEILFSAVTGAEMNTNPTAKCTECGDVRLNGEEMQLKLWNATITTMEQVERFKARA